VSLCDQARWGETGTVEPPIRHRWARMNSANTHGACRPESLGITRNHPESPGTTRNHPEPPGTTRRLCHR
jgi:hypothetical protein